MTTKGFTPAPAIAEVGALPYGVLFVDNGDGTATLGGIPAIGSLTTYTITITASNATPQSATQSFTLTITSAPLSLLTITASSATMTYGGAVPTITAIYSLVSPTLTGLICSTLATGSSPVGTYISSCTGAVGNYAISYATGTVTVGPATLTASIINNPTKPYDGTNTATLGSSNFQLTGLLPGQSITETVTVTGTYASPNAGTGIAVSANLASGDFTAGGSTQLTNYTLPTTASGTGQITALTLSAVIVGNPTKSYDGTTTATLGSSNFQLTGLVTGESITVTQTAGAYNDPNVATATTVTASLGSGNFTPVGSTQLTNYVLPTSASGPGQITAATATVTLGNLTQTYTGSPLTPTATTTPTGLAIVWTGAPDTNPGSYAVTASVNNPNYQGSASGTFTVGQAPAITTANTTTFTVGMPGSFTVTTTGFPVAGITEVGGLPSGVSFVDNHNGTAMLSGTPATGSNPTYNITITANNGVSPNATQSFTLAVATLNISPASVNFGTVYLEQEGVQFVTLTNTGDMPISISSINVAAPGNALRDFGDITTCTPFIRRLPGTLGAGQSCMIAVRFAAEVKIFSPTLSTATLLIADNAVGSPQSVGLSATVINPRASLSPTRLNFSTQREGSTTTKTVTLTNTGDTPLTLGTLSISGDFAIAPSPATTCANGGTVQPSTSCVISVTFTPEAEGTLTGMLIIPDNARNSPQRVRLRGKGD